MKQPMYDIIKSVIEDAPSRGHDLKQPFGLPQRAGKMAMPPHGGMT